MLYMFSVFDKAVGVFEKPFACRAKAEAIRMFSDAVNDGQSPFRKYPADFELYYVGLFDPAIGQMDGSLERMLSALDVLQDQVQVMPPVGRRAAE